VDTAALLWQVQAAGRLLTGGVLDPDAIGEGGRRMVLAQTGFKTMDDLQSALDAQTAAAAGVIARKLAGTQ
jgi:glutamate-ammonia-ligase adenylyltransferase